MTLSNEQLQADLTDLNHDIELRYIILKANLESPILSPLDMLKTIKVLIEREKELTRKEIALERSPVTSQSHEDALCKV